MDQTCPAPAHPEGQRVHDLPHYIKNGPFNLSLSVERSDTYSPPAAVFGSFHLPSTMNIFTLALFSVSRSHVAYVRRVCVRSPRDSSPGSASAAAPPGTDADWQVWPQGPLGRAEIRPTSSPIPLVRTRIGCDGAARHRCSQWTPLSSAGPAELAYQLVFLL